MDTAQLRWEWYYGKIPKINVSVHQDTQWKGYYVELRNPEDTNEVMRPFWDPSENPTPPDEAKGTTLY